MNDLKNIVKSFEKEKKFREIKKKLLAVIHGLLKFQAQEPYSQHFTSFVTYEWVQ
jgi:hypothetical protein